MIAHRNGWIASVILIFAFVPTASTFYRGLPILSSQIERRIPGTIDGMIGSDTKRKASKVLDNFRTKDWADRVYPTASGTPITLFIARGFDFRPFFHLPEYAILDRSWSERTYTTDHWTINMSQLPVHSLKLTGLSFEQKAYYLLLYDNQTIGSPYWFLIRNLPEMLIKKRKLFTIVFVSYKTDQTDEGLGETAKRLLISVYNQLLS